MEMPEKKCVIVTAKGKNGNQVTAKIYGENLDVEVVDEKE